MIDIGFTKIALVGLVALVVIGPEKLPTVARMAGSLFGRAQRYINQVKSEVSREIELDELRKMQKDVQEAAGQMEQSIAKSMADTEQSLNTAWSGDAAPDRRNDDTLFEPFHLEEPDAAAVKAKNFRKKKLARNTAVPTWYKRQHGRKLRVMSGAARVARYRPATGKAAGSFY